LLSGPLFMPLLCWLDYAGLGFSCFYVINDQLRDL